MCSLGPNFRHNLHNCRHTQLLADTNSVIMKLWSWENRTYFSAINIYIAHQKNILDSLKPSATMPWLIPAGKLIPADHSGVGAGAGPEVAALGRGGVGGPCGR